MGAGPLTLLSLHRPLVDGSTMAATRLVAVDTAGVEIQRSFQKGQANHPCRTWKNLAMNSERWVIEIRLLLTKSGSHLLAGLSGEGYGILNDEVWVQSKY